MRARAPRHRAQVRHQRGDVAVIQELQAVRNGFAHGSAGRRAPRRKARLQIAGQLGIAPGTDTELASEVML